MKKRGTKLMEMGLVTLVLLGLAFCFSSVAQAAPAQISVSPASIAEVSQGDTFSINITVDPVGTGICAAQYVLLFNNMPLHATSQTQGPFLSQDGAETIVPANIINNTVGKIEYGENRVVEHGVTASGTLASITFEVIGTSGRSDLKLSDVILLDQNLEKLETEINHGICTIGNVTGEPAVTDITIEEAHEMLEEEPEEIILLDVRTKGEYDAGYISGAKLIPSDELENRMGELDKSKKIIVYCGSGGRSRAASEILVQHGFENVYNMLGGINEWKVKFPVSTQFVPTSTPTPTIAITPSPALSPSLSPTPTPAASPAVTVSPTPTPMPEGKWKIPGFEAVFAIIGLLAMSYSLLIRKKRGDRK